MRSLTIAIVLFLAIPCRANMASGISEGTLTTSPFISKHVDIVREKILIIPDNDFKTAFFKIEYFIKANKNGVRIPLLFYASEFKENFRIWVDGQEIPLKEIPESYQKLEGTPFEDFSYLFERTDWDDLQQIVIDETSTSGFYVTINDLKYFETDISEGLHSIQVEYTADYWCDSYDWVNEYSFRYALSPARYWKSFKDLEIVIDASRCYKPFTTNLGEPINSSNSISTWRFSTLPTEVIHITFVPEISFLAKTLISISPTGLAVAISIVLGLLHFLAIKRFRKNHQSFRYSWVTITGGILLPFVMLMSYMYSFDLIDAVIGKEAGRFHGYTFVVLISYPVLMPIYWITMHVVDKRIKRHQGQ